MSWWTKTAALSFGTFKTTDLLKELFTRATGMTLQPYLKSTVAMGLAGAVAVLYEDEWKDRLLLAASVAGGSAVVHEGYEVLSTKADQTKLAVMMRAPVSMRAQTPRGPGQRVPPL